MAGDSVSIPTNVAHSDTVSRTQQSQATDQQAQEKAARKMAESTDEDTALLKNLSETERAKMRRHRRDERRHEERRAMREQTRQKKDDDDPRGGKLDVKA